MTTTDGVKVGEVRSRLLVRHRPAQSPLHRPPLRIARALDTRAHLRARARRRHRRLGVRSFESSPTTASRWRRSGRATRGRRPTATFRGSIPEVDTLPFDVNTLIQMWMMPGGLDDHDRSGQLWMLAKEIWKAADDENAAVDDLTVAGVIKYKDHNWLHYKGPKYWGRDNMDEEYVHVATKSREEWESEHPKKPWEVDTVNWNDDGTRPEFYWDGYWLYHQRSARSQPKRVADFDIRLIETVNRWVGDGVRLPEESHVVITCRDGRRDRAANPSLQGQPGAAGGRALRRPEGDRRGPEPALAGDGSALGAPRADPRASRLRAHRLDKGP